jgi:hypothetical protein
VVIKVVKPVDLKEVVNFAGSDDRQYMISFGGGSDYLNYLPANKFLIPVDSSIVFSNGTVKPYFRNRFISPIIWDYTESDAFKGDLAIMDMISTNNWKRPIYYSTTVPSSQYKGLEKFFVQEGLAYRLAPIRTDKPEQGEFGIIDPVVMYDNLMNKFSWGNAADPKVYLDENNKRMLSNFRRIFGHLGKELLIKGDTVRAVEVAKRGLAIIPPEKIPYDFFVVGLAEVLYRAGEKEEADKVIGQILAYSKEYLDYAISLSPGSRYGLEYPIGINMQAMLDIYNMAADQKIDSLTKVIEPEISKYYSRLYSGK